MRINHITRKFNNIKIGEKLLLSYILVVFLPVLLVGIILITGIRNMAVENAIREATFNVERIYTRVDEAMKLLMDISYKLQMDQNLERLLLTNYKGDQEVFESYYEYTEFNNLINLYSSEVREIRIYSENQTLLNSGHFYKVTPELSESEWYQNIVKANGKIRWQYLQDDYHSRYHLCLARLIKTNLGNKTTGALIISMNGDYLNSLLRNEPYDMYFCDDNGNIIASGKRDMVGKNINDSEISIIASLSDGSWQTEYFGMPANVIVRNMSPGLYNGHFKIVSMVPVSFIERQATEAAVLGVVIMISCLLFAFLLIIVFTRAISKRVKKLSMDMHEVAMGNFDLDPTMDGKDEIGQLSEDLGVMIHGIKQLINEIQYIDAQKNQLAIKQREIKLKLLANQINPHFLFNALETIRMNAHSKGDREIAEVVMLLGKIIRKNLETGNEMVSLETEMDLVKSYLKIQKFRYRDRINFSIQYENDEIRESKILPMTIQPIVENSVIHGIESKQCDGKISIYLAKKDGCLVITVEDNGNGMNKERLQELILSLDEMEDASGSRIGLKNVHQRIRLFYGDKYGLRIDSVENIGTRIEIIMPGEWCEKVKSINY